jgi:hypothetical protein
MGNGFADSQNIGTLTVRVNGIPGELKFGEWKWDRVWSTISYSDGDTSRRDFFVGQIGQQISGGVRTLTDVDTNMPRDGVNGLPIDWEIFVFSMRTKILDVVGSNDPETQPSNSTWEDSVNADTPNRRMWFELDRKCMLDFKVNNKTRSQGRFEDYPSAGGINVVTNDVAETLANNGIPSPRDGFQYVIPVHLRPNVSFKVGCQPVVALQLTQAQQVNDADNTTVEPQVQFEGLLKVPVT